MKHTALTRHTPLTRSTPPKRQKRRDPVSPELRLAVLERDRMCVLARFDDQHVCRDKWGTIHAWNDARFLTLEHVKDELRMGVRAASTLQTLVAMCYGGNVGVPSKAQREAIRAYLQEVNA